MNTQLITIYDNSILTKAISARDLYNFLEVRKDFSNWIKQQIERADLKENEDYIKSHLEGEVINQQLTNVGNKIEYYLTLDAGKNIGMMSNCQKGKDVRRYFIECEKELRENHPKTYLEAIKALVIKEEERLALEHKINTSTLFPDKEKVYDKERAYKKQVRDIYPFLYNCHITNILEYYTRSKYKETNSYIKDELACVQTFFEECQMSISKNKITVLITHPCLLTSKLRVSKENAIEYLDYTEDDFE